MKLMSVSRLKWLLIAYPTDSLEKCSWNLLFCNIYPNSFPVDKKIVNSKHMISSDFFLFYNEMEYSIFIIFKDTFGNSSRGGGPILKSMEVGYGEAIIPLRVRARAGGSITVCRAN